MGLSIECASASLLGSNDTSLANRVGGALTETPFGPLMVGYAVPQETLQPHPRTKFFSKIQSIPPPPVVSGYLFDSKPPPLRSPSPSKPTLGRAFACEAVN